MNSWSEWEETPGLFEGSSDDPRYQALGILYEIAVSDGLDLDLDDALEGKLHKAELIVRGVTVQTERLDSVIEKAASRCRAWRTSV